VIRRMLIYWTAWSVKNSALV